MREEPYAVGLRIALVSYDARELRVVSRYLEERGKCFSCRAYRGGEPLLQALQMGEQLDVVVLGEQLEDMDEGTFILRLRRAQRRPILLFLNESRHDNTQAASLKSDGGYLTRQRSLQEFVQQLWNTSGDNTARIEQMCLDLYRQWGIPQPNTNCEYLTRALCVACSTTDKLAVRKEILQEVAEQCRVSVSAVDSGLRRLIDTLETQQPPAWLACKQQYQWEGRRVSSGKLIYALQSRFFQQGTMEF